MGFKGSLVQIQSLRHSGRGLTKHQSPFLFRMKAGMADYSVLIPAFNAEQTIGIVLDELQRVQPQPSGIIVVDDGSEDKTAVLCQQKQIRLLQNKKNRGKGYSLQKGFADFLIHSANEWLLCMDGDLQHPVASIPDFFTKQKETGAHLIIGNRKKNIRSMPPERVLSNRLTSWVLSRLTGMPILDSQCGFRLIHRSILKKIELTEEGFQMETEFILRAAEQKIRPEFVPIPTIYNGEISQIRHMADTIRFIKLILEAIRK